MTKHYRVSIEVYILLVATLGSLGGVLLALLLLRWPVVGGFALAGIVSALMWWGIYQIVTSAARPLPEPEPPATVDGLPFYDVEVQP